MYSYVEVDGRFDHVSRRRRRNRNAQSPVETYLHAVSGTMPVRVAVIPLQAFGEKGIHARSAVGMSSMPLDIPVELEAIVEVV